MSTPGEVALDAHGTLYVVNNGNGTVTEYPAGQSTPSVTLTGLSGAKGVAIDLNGDVYVSNFGPPAAIVEYDAGQTTPTRTIVDRRLIRGPVQMFFDLGRDLYVIDNVTGVYVIRYGSSRPVSLRLKGLGSEPGGLSMDPTTGDLYEGDAAPGDGTDRARMYPAGRRAPARQLSETSSVHAVATGTLPDHAGRQGVVVFVPAYGTAQPIFVFRPHESSAFEQIPTSLRGINGVAFKPAT